MILKYAAIDIGTNSVRYLLAEKTSKGILHIHTDIATTRLGEGLYAGDRKLRRKNMEQTAQAVAAFVEHANKNHCQKILCVATSAVRDARNKEEFQRVLMTYSGISARIITGKEEALAGYKGATIDCQGKDAVLVDIGGGSTEVITFSPEGVQSKSYQCGAVRLRELFAGDFASAKKYILQTVPLCSYEGKQILWIGGTASAAAMIYAGKREYEDCCVHMKQLPREWIKNFTEECLKYSLEKLTEVCCFEPSRAEILPYGMLIMSHILSCFDAQYVTVSEKGLMDGVILLDDVEKTDCR